MSKVRLMLDDGDPVYSSARKRGQKGYYRIRREEGTKVVPVWVSFFGDQNSFARELNALKTANRSGVGPVVIEFGKRKGSFGAAPSTGDSPAFQAAPSTSDSPASQAASSTSGSSAPRAAFRAAPSADPAPASCVSASLPCDNGGEFVWFITEEYVGTPLGKLVSQSAQLPPTSPNPSTPQNLSSLQSASIPQPSQSGSRASAWFDCDDAAGRKRQAIKVFFDIARVLIALHQRHHYYLDVKPGNVCIVKYGSRPEDLHASLVDFESMVVDEDQPPSLATMECYQKLFVEYAQAKGLNVAAATNTEIDFGFAVLVSACVLARKEIVDLSVEDIDNAIAALPVDFFSTLSCGFSVRKLDASDMARIAETLGIPKIDDSLLPNSGLCSLDALCGYADPIDLQRLAFDPFVIFEARKGDLALACHNEWAKLDSPGETAVNFLDQDEDKIQQGMRQASDMQLYVSSLGYKLVPGDYVPASSTVIEALNCEQILLVAKWEHERWARLHEALGYEYAERVNGKRLVKKNEYLKSWDELARIVEGDAESIPCEVDEEVYPPTIAPESLAGRKPEERVEIFRHTRASKCIQFAEGMIAKLNDVGLAVVDARHGI